MGYRHSSIDEYRVLKTVNELLATALMTTPGPQQKKAFTNLADYVATERDAAAIRAAKSKAESARQARLGRKGSNDE